MAFRVITLQKPRLLTILKAFLETEKFSLPNETAQFLVAYFDIFKRMKDEKLYSEMKDKKIPGQEFNLVNLRGILKLAAILKN